VYYDLVVAVGAGPLLFHRSTISHSACENPRTLPFVSMYTHVGASGSQPQPTMFRLSWTINVLHFLHLTAWFRTGFFPSPVFLLTCQLAFMVQVARALAPRNLGSFPLFECAFHRTAMVASPVTAVWHPTVRTSRIIQTRDDELHASFAFLERVEIQLLVARAHPS